MSKAIKADPKKQKAVKAAMTQEQRDFLDGKDEATPVAATKAPKAEKPTKAPKAAKDPLEEIGTKATPKKAKAAADDLGLGDAPAAPRKSALAGKKLNPTEAGLKARGTSVRALVVKACKGGCLYETAVNRLLADEAFKAPRSKKFDSDREAYAKNRIARMVAIEFVSAE